MPEELDANVLVVDDEEQFLKVFSQRLQGRGLKVETATSGEEAINKTKGKEFDAIILDLIMPGMSGIETLKRIKKENPDIQIIMLTGHGTVEKSVEAMKMGAVDFIEKPADMSKVLQKISEAKHKRVVLIEKKSQERIKEIIDSRSW